MVADHWLAAALLACGLCACGATQLHLKSGESVCGRLEHATESSYVMTVADERVEVPAVQVVDATFSGAQLRIAGGALLFGGAAPLTFLSSALLTVDRNETCETCTDLLLPFGAVAMAGLITLAIGAASRGDGRDVLRFDPPSLARRNRKLGRLFLVFGVSMSAASTLAYFEGDTRLTDAIGHGLLSVGLSLTAFGVGYAIRGARIRRGREARVGWTARGLEFDLSL